MRDRSKCPVSCHVQHTVFSLGLLYLIGWLTGTVFFFVRLFVCFVLVPSHVGWFPCVVRADVALFSPS